MPNPRVSPAAATRSDQGRSADASVPPRWLGLVHAVWVGTAMLALGVLVASIPGYVLAASRSDFVGRVVEAPAGLVHVLDLAGALASFAAALVCLTLAGLLFWRKPGNGMALFVSFYLLVYGTVLAGPLENLDTLIPGSGRVAGDLLQPVLFVVPSVALLAVFPNGRFVPPWTRWLVLLSVLISILWIPVAPYTPANWWTDPTNWLVWADGAFWVLALCPAMYAQVYRYRRVSSPTERQQAKWVAFSFVWWLLMAGVSWVLGLAARGSSLSPSAATPWWTPLGSLLWYLSLDILPLTFTVTLLRYRLFDIDLLIRRTLVYGTLTAILGAVYGAGVVGAQAVVQALTGQTGQQPVFIVASTLLVAALFNPLRSQLQAVIDRRFYRRKYVAERTVADFGATLRTETDLGQLSSHLVAVVWETMQPAHVSLWLRPVSDGSPGSPPSPSEPATAWTTRSASADPAESV